ncbi:hypothetical protein [Agrobacterium tumefaciens]|jgi:hypothetical protein|uniref:hypothetical protein n=1 Tax=Agrobacterium tumefaciens TaxID=358 RepID=UPI0021FD9A59|nr:hypothetical protein FY131_27085 [Agrobacterium tumefaciens]
MPADDPKDYNSYVNPAKVDSFVKWASIVWLYVSVMAAIMRGGKMTGWDMAGFVVGISTAFGYWFKFSWHRTVAEAVPAILFLLFLVMVTVLLAGPLAYFGLV